MMDSNTTELAEVSAERFRVAFDHAVIGMALVAPDGRWLQTNAALQRIVGYSAEELAKMTFADVTHPDDLAAAERRIRRRLRGEPTDERIEKRYLRSNGEAIWVSVSSTLVQGADGRLLYSVAQIEDISQRVQARRALEEAEERFRRAFDDAPIGMALVTPAGWFVRANRTMCELTGYEEKELLTRTFADLTYPDDLPADLEQARQLLDGEIRSYRMEKRYRRSDGNLIWVMLSVSLVRSADGEPLHFVSQVEDITERRNAERRLRH
jgi:PAS domain S-box-containing protein